MEAGFYYKHRIRLLYNQNADLISSKNNILSRLLGHADVTITYNIYVHLYGDGFDEMYEALVPEE